MGPLPSAPKRKTRKFDDFLDFVSLRRLEAEFTTELSRDKAWERLINSVFGTPRILGFWTDSGVGLEGWFGANVGHRQVRLHLSVGGELWVACAQSYRGE